MTLAAVLPAYNEEKAIGEVIDNLKNNVDLIVVVDDGSTDQTAKTAKERGVIVLEHFLNRGQGAALQTGIDFCLNAGAEIIITFDADGQHDPTDIQTLVEPIINGQVDVVLGSRFIKNQKSKIKNQNLGIPFLKYLILKLAVIFDRWRTGLKITDTHNGLRAFNQRAAKLIKINQDGMAHASEILEQIAKYQFKYIEIPAQVRYTPYSKSKGQSIFNSLKILLDLVLAKISK